MVRKSRATPGEKRPHGRSLSDFGRLSPAEKLLLEAARIGDIAVIAESRPESTADDNVIRAGFLRFLALGGDLNAPVHEHGVQLRGAWVDGVLDLANAATIGSFRCLQCNFDEPLMLWRSRVRGDFSLFGSTIYGMKADDLLCEGSLFLNEGFQSIGSIVMTSARIDGDLVCDGAKIDGKGGHALLACGVQIKGDAAFREGFASIGLIDLFCAKIDGCIISADAKFDGVGDHALLVIDSAIGGSVIFEKNTRTYGVVSFAEARIAHGLHCSASILDGRGQMALSASGAHIGGSLRVDDGAKMVGALYLHQVRIDGQLVLGPAVLDGLSGAALFAGDAEIRGGIIGQEELVSFGALIFSNAKVGSSVQFNRSSIDGKGGRALVAERIEIAGDLLFSREFNSTGEIVFSGARINGGLFFSGAVLDGGGRNSALFDRAYIGGGLVFDAGSRASGAFVISYAKVSSIEFYQGEVIGNDAHAIVAFGTVVAGNFVFDRDFEAKGIVDVANAHVGADFRFKRAIFHGDGRCALMATSSVVKDSVFFFDSFLAKGTVTFIGSKIGGDFVCREAKFHSQSDVALDAGGAEAQNVFFGAGFELKGSVYLIGTVISRDFQCENVSFDAAAEVPLAATHMQVSNRLIFRNFESPVPRVWLSAVSAGVLCDEVDAWGEGLVLNNFAYGSIAGTCPTAAHERIAWLDKQMPMESGLAGNSSDFRPQPWRQLQKVLREMGHAEDARQVAIALEHRMRNAGVIGQSQDTLRPWLSWTNRPRRWFYRKVACFFHWWFWALTGYGYRPMRLIVWMLTVWLGCAAFYWAMALPPRNVFSPSNPLVFQASFYRPCLPCDQIREATQAVQSAEVAACRIAQARMHEELRQDGKRFYPGNWYLCPRVREEYTGFSPLAYSLDVILPLVDLQQQKDWGAMIPTPEPGVVSELGAVTWKHVTRLVVWFETLFGWLASLLLVAIVSGLTKRRED
jgi:hypothetical protein